MTQPFKTSTYYLQCEVITPVHIGSGETLQKDSDFIIQNDPKKANAIIIPDQKALLSLLDDAIPVDRVTKLSQLVDLAMPSETVIGYQLEQQAHVKPPSSIRAMMKTAFNQPYLPGSSLKGALRTILLARSMEERIGKNKPDQPEKLLDKLPQKNLMRALKVSDATFQKQDLFLNSVHLISQRRNLHDQVESLGYKAKSVLTVTIDHQLVAELRKNTQNTMTLPDTWEELKEQINQYTQNWLKTELTYLNNRDQLSQATQFYHQLSKAIDASQSHSAYLPVGFGLGWRGITGDCVTESQKKFLGKKRPEFRFPKTRRISGNGQPLGWIRLTQVGQSDYHAHQSECQTAWHQDQDFIQTKLAEKDQQQKQKEYEKQQEIQRQQQEAQRWEQLSQEEQAVELIEQRLTKGESPRGGMGCALIKDFEHVVYHYNWANAHQERLLDLAQRLFTHLEVNAKKNAKAKALKKYIRDELSL